MESKYFVIREIIATDYSNTHELSKKVAEYLRGQGENPDYNDIQSVLGCKRILKLLDKYPISKAAATAGEMIKIVSSNSLAEQKHSKLKSILKEFVKK
jgi:hypothetical protein